MGLPYFAPEWPNFGAIASRVLPALVTESDPIYTILNSRRAPRSFANEWVGDTFSFFESPDFIPLTLSLVDFFIFTHCESDRARLAALVTMQLCGLFGRARFQGRTRPISSCRVNEAFTSLPLQYPTFWPTI